jgi:hypothetical protein
MINPSLKVARVSLIEFSDRLIKFRKQSIQSSFRIEKLIKKHALEKI